MSCSGGGIAMHGKSGLFTTSLATTGHFPHMFRTGQHEALKLFMPYQTVVVQGGGTPKSLGLARAKAPQITSETKQAAKTCSVITDKHIIYSGYTGGKPQTTSRQEKRGTTSEREKGKSTRREESKSVNHEGCCSSPDPLLGFPAWEVSSLQVLQGGVRNW